MGAAEGPAGPTQGCAKRWKEWEEAEKVEWVTSADGERKWKPETRVARRYRRITQMTPMCATGSLPEIVPTWELRRGAKVRARADWAEGRFHEPAGLSVETNEMFRPALLYWDRTIATLPRSSRPIAPPKEPERRQYAIWVSVVSRLLRPHPALNAVSSGAWTTFLEEMDRLGEKLTWGPNKEGNPEPGPIRAITPQDVWDKAAAKTRKRQEQSVNEGEGRLVPRGRRGSLYNYALCIKHELAHKRSKPARLFHAPIGRAVAMERPFYVPLEERMHRSVVSVKGLTPLERARYVLLLAFWAGVRRVVAADASGWDASWRREHLEAGDRWARKWCEGPWERIEGYDALPHDSKWKTGGVLIDATHPSGAGNNSLFNGVENVSARRTAWRRVRPNEEPPAMVVEGDDALDFRHLAVGELDSLDDELTALL